MTVGYTSLPEVQTAVTALLQANSGFTSICFGPFDPAPENQAFPYVTFGEHSEQAWLAFGSLGRVVNLTFHIWSQQFGYVEAYSILNAMNQALDSAKLTLVHYTNVIVLFVTALKYADPDMITRHLIVKYQLWNTAN